MESDYDQGGFVTSSPNTDRFELMMRGSDDNALGVRTQNLAIMILPRLTWWLS